MGGTVPGTQTLDRNTLLPVDLLNSGLGYNESGTKVGGPVNKTEQSQAVQSDNAVTSTRQASTQLNATPVVIDALNKLVQQLSDRPAISQAELDQKAPLPTLSWQGNGWVATDPLTGRTFSAYGNDPELQKLRNDRLAQRDKLTQQAGVIKGGTAQQLLTNSERQTEIQRDRQLQQTYSKDAAATDANALINKSIADALTAAMPQITAGLEGAGTSRSTIAAALTQKAAIKGGVEGAALGANLSAQYGQIDTQLSGVLEALTRQDPHSPAALLLEAVSAGKGLINSGITSNTQQTAGTKATTGTTNTQVGPTVEQTAVTRSPILPGMVPQAAPVAAAKQADTYGVLSFNSPSPVAPNTGLDSAYRGVFGGNTSGDIYNIEGGQ